LLGNYDFSHHGVSTLTRRRVCLLQQVMPCTYILLNAIIQDEQQSYFATDDRSVSQSIRPSWRWASPGLMTRFWL